MQRLAVVLKSKPVPRSKRITHKESHDVNELFEQPFHAMHGLHHQNGGVQHAGWLRMPAEASGVPQVRLHPLHTILVTGHRRFAGTAIIFKLLSNVAGQNVDLFVKLGRDLTKAKRQQNAMKTLE